MTRSLQKIQIGISSCLLGEQVRYDGGHKNNSYIVQTLGQYFEFHPFCPEVSIGLGVPRETIRLVEQQERILCVGTKTPELDVTEKLIQCANEQQSWQQSLCGYILKKDSPSCGMERVKVYRNEQPQKIGVGLYAKQMMSNFPHLPIEEEGRLGDPVLRENFIHRVFIFQRWKQMLSQNVKAAAITEFHARHKLILMSHDQHQYRRLGQLVSTISQWDIGEFCARYLTTLMTILKIPATRKNHVNVLQHIQGYLKRDLDKEDKKELSETIEQYRSGLLPLIVPITLLRHHFRKCPNEYINNSYYMAPHPAELMLLNDV
ncbi:MAG: DUF1722 domain-containing protein [Pseudomonadales bacterium]|nr:DUF1722 domain-containing protein [Pseudomonadales bacterium]MCP5214037.1 DUF1722 domain-containing protein [Pseudomonadales bacterium]MCP5302757.1 DUF1722 domain-containing protein [Pseudomonadales bacterium]